MNIFYKNKRIAFILKYIIACLLCSLTITGCKRTIHPSEMQLDSDVQKIISKADFDEIMNLKRPSKSVLIEGKYQLTIPTNCRFETMVLSRDEILDIEADTTKFSKIDLLKIKKGYTSIKLLNIFNRHDLYTEEIFIIPAEDAHLTREDLKENLQSDAFIFYEDENSIIFDDTNLQVFHLDYCEQYKSYIYYTARISWAKEFSKSDKVNLCAHLLANAKNLTYTKYTDTKFTSWKDYTQNTSTLEIKMMQKIFKNLEKELKVFMVAGDKAQPRTPENYPFVTLYKTSEKDALTIQEFFNSVKKGTKKKSDDYSRSDDPLKINNFNFAGMGEEQGCYIIQYKAQGENNFYYNVVCPINYNDTAFFLKNSDYLDDVDIDLFIKAFIYFSKNYTLTIK